MIFELIYQTIIIVLLLSFSFGPAFFALINAGIKHGYKTASLFAVGVVASDFVVALLTILLIHFGASNLIQDEKSQRFMGILAGIILIVFGSVHLAKPIPKTEQENAEIELPSHSSMFIKGFLLNCFNPAVWLLWLGNVTIISNSFNYSFWKMALYFSVVLGLVLLVELGKVSIAGKLKRVLTQKTMYIVNVITGTLLVIFGLVLIYEHYFKTKLL
ncbi:MAG: LysE family transporter [Bacteroidetes bacterium]|nr:LysE family transporter [Bacteroidota bacterium]